MLPPYRRRFKVILYSAFFLSSYPLLSTYPFPNVPALSEKDGTVCNNSKTEHTWKDSQLQCNRSSRKKMPFKNRGCQFETRNPKTAKVGFCAANADMEATHSQHTVNTQSTHNHHTVNTQSTRSQHIANTDSRFTCLDCALTVCVLTVCGLCV